MENALYCTEANSRKLHANPSATSSDTSPTGDYSNDSAYSMLLRGELLGDRPQGESQGAEFLHHTPSAAQMSAISKRLFRFRSSIKTPVSSTPFAVSPIGTDPHRMISSTKRHQRKIAQSPFKVLDAPSLQDDFYLNLVDWSVNNVLSVSLLNAKAAFAVSDGRDAFRLSVYLGWTRRVRLPLVCLHFQSYQAVRPDRR